MVLLPLLWCVPYININISTLVNFALAQGVEVQNSRPDNLDAAMCKAHEVDLCLLQLGPG